MQDRDYGQPSYGDLLLLSKYVVHELIGPPAWTWTREARRAGKGAQEGNYGYVQLALELVRGDLIW